jgi:pimeloyl-ACP methyl ester carboxylesterase
VLTTLQNALAAAFGSSTGTCCTAGGAGRMRAPGRVGSSEPTRAERRVATGSGSARSGSRRDEHLSYDRVVSYVDIDGHPRWVIDEGVGDTVVVLHGAFHGSDAMLRSLSDLGTGRRLVAFDRRGHGRTADTPAAFHYEEMAGETVSVMESVGVQSAHLVGYSDGAIVAMYVALRRPELVRSLVLIGSNIRSAGEVLTLDPNGPSTAAMRSAYAALSPDGAQHFDEVATKTFDMFSREPNFAIDELRTITAPSLIVVADRDSTSIDETLALFDALPTSQLAVIPGAGHTVVWEKPDLVLRLIEDFIGSLN